MSNKRNESNITPVGNAPAFLTPFLEQDRSMETMQHHTILNRAMVIQPLTRSELREEHGVGTAIIPAANVRLCRPQEKLVVVPILFFDEFITWGDRLDKTQPGRRATSLAHTSDIARKAADPQLRIEGYGPVDPKTGRQQFNLRHTHHLNWLCAIYGGHPLRGTHVVFSFSRGEFTKGRSWLAGVQMRRLGSRQVPLWSQVWELSIGQRKNDKGEWYGFDPKNPESHAPYIDEADAQAMHAMHVNAKKAYDEMRLSVGHEAVDATGEDAEDAAGAPDVGTAAAPKGEF